MRVTAGHTRDGLGWLRPGTQLRLRRGLLTWTVLMRDTGGVWLKTPFSSTPVELLPIQDVQGWVQDGTMEVNGQ